MNFLCTNKLAVANKLKQAGYKSVVWNAEKSIYLFENNPSICFDRKQFKGAVFTNTLTF